MSTSTTEEIKIPLRVFIDKEKKKVVFAEANSDFVDILFSFLTLPMGTILKLLRKHSDSEPVSIGSPYSLYQGLANLDPKYLWTEEYCRSMLLYPSNSSEFLCCKLKLNVDDSEPTKYFICEDWSCSRCDSSFVSNWNSASCVYCGNLMNRNISLKNSNVGTSTHSKGGVFVNETATFIVTDDLRVFPNLLSSSLEQLFGHGIRDMSGVEAKTMNFGFKEFLNLLKCSLFSKSPLSDLFFGKIPSVNSESANACKTQMGNKTTISQKMTLKVTVLKKSNEKKVLFAQAEEEFIDFIFSFLTLPLARVVYLLSGNSSLGSTDNLYKSVSDLSVGKYMKSQVLKQRLLNPSLASHYLSKNQIFPVYEERSTNQLYCYSDKRVDYLTLLKGRNSGCIVYSAVTLRDPKVEGGFVRGPALFMVTDDLVVTNSSSSISGISLLDRMKIPFSDVEEQVNNIGMDEALSILKASLHSTSALTDGLNLFLKSPKEKSNLTHQDLINFRQP